jgi:hypothetical protein
MTRHACIILASLLVVSGHAIAGQTPQETPADSPPPVFELAPEAYIQLDWRTYPNSPVTPGTGRLEFNTFEIRRLLAGVNGQWRGVRFEVTADPQDLEGTLVKDAYAEVRPGSYRIRFGQFKPPGSREYGTGARQTDFLERAALGRALAAQRDVGGALHGDIGRLFDYEVGLFAGDDSGSSRRSGLTFAGRLEAEPRRDLVLAAYGSEGRLTANDTEPENGFEGRLSSGYRFFENVYVQGWRTRLGGDVEWSPGRWQFTVEAIRVRDERQEQGVDFNDLPAVVGTGASATTRWRFARRRDVALRYEYLGFDDVGPTTDMASVRPRAADLRARAGHAVTFGGSWGVTPWIRLMGNAGIDWFSDARTAPEPGRAGGYWILGTRLQIELPGILGLRVR